MTFSGCLASSDFCHSAKFAVCRFLIQDLHDDIRPSLRRGLRQNWLAGLVSPHVAHLFSETDTPWTERRAWPSLEHCRQTLLMPEVLLLSSPNSETGLLLPQLGQMRSTTTALV